MASAIPIAETQAPLAALIPRLEPGDHLTRVEFERRYQAMPCLKKAELIEGVVYVPSPVSVQHGTAHARIGVWLGLYKVKTPGVHLLDNATVRLDFDNEPQPDACLRLDDTLGGQSRVDEEGYLAGSPELVVEVAATSASYDLHTKLHAYRRNGVREYIVWRVLENALDWFVLADGRYRQQGDAQGMLKSAVFPGLWLDVQALLAGDDQKLLAVLETGLASTEHAEFTARLAQPRR